MKESNTLFRIKPLEWEGEILGLYDSIMAYTPFGNYTIRRNIIYDDLGEDCSVDGFIWEYCFDEYYNEGYYAVDSIEQAKSDALKHWVERLSKSLIEIEK